LISPGAKDMVTKRVVLLLGVALLGAVLISAGVGAANPIGPAAPRELSDRALSIIGAIDPAARIEPQDLQCNVKVGWGLAQCGSQASSCKNCHEVKGEDPVNSKGDWHVAHAFGDFCEFCHGGNVQATDEAAAHQGLVQPLDDVKTNCSSCHADDYQTRAEKYAAVLGVTVGSSGGGSAQPPATLAAPSQAGQPSQPAQPAASQPAASQPAIAPSSNEIVDYVAQYRVVQSLIPSASTGTIITSLLLLLTVVGGGAFIFWNEKRLRSTPHAVVGVTTAATDERSQELEQLQPILAKMDTEALRSLRTVLSKRS
jgi:hypothetical protein